MQFLQIVVLVLAVLVAVESAAVSKLPKWVTNVCYRDDPKFDECALKSGQAAIAQVVMGERKTRIPVLDPLDISLIRVTKEDTNIGMDVTVYNATFKGFTGAVLKDLNVDFEKRHVLFKILFPRLELFGTYNVSGQILILPITGTGPGNLTLVDTTIVYEADYDLKPLKNKQDYIVVKDIKTKFDTNFAAVYLENLFDGDKQMGATLNNFMNENWKDLIYQIGPVVTDQVADLMNRIFKYVLDNVPFDDIAPLKPK